MNVMDTKKAPKSQATAKNGSVKPGQKKSRAVLWIFLLLFILTGTIGSAFYFQLIPLDPVAFEKTEPYRLKAVEFFSGVRVYVEQLETLLKRMAFSNQPEEHLAVKKPQTNFPLVDVDGDTGSRSGGLVSTAVASAAPLQAEAKAAGPTQTGMRKNDGTDSHKVIGKLAKLYAAMKTEEAVAVFDNLEEEQIVKILFRMEEESAAKILAALDPKKAASLTQALIKQK